MKQWALLLPLLLACSNQRATGVPDAIALVGHWEGELTSKGKHWSVASDFQIENGTIFGTAAAIDLGMFGIPWQAIEVDGGDVELRMRVDRAVISMSCELHGDTLVGDYSDDRTRAEVLLIKQSSTPIIFRTEELTVEGSGGHLAATIVYPNTAGPYAAVVLGHGSGQVTRDVSSYRSRAYMFAHAGVAAVMYDRQGKGASTGDTSRILPIAKLSGDMLAVVQATRLIPDIRPEAVGVYGLSQAGWVVPRTVAASEGAIAFAITVSAPGITPDSQNVIAAGYVEEKAISKALKNAGLASGLIENIVGNHRDTRAERLTSSESIAPDDEAVPGFSKYDPIPDWEQISIPVLAIWGENDRLVPAQGSRDVIAAALNKAGNLRAVTMVFPGATHTLEIDRDAEQEWDWNRLAPGFQDSLVEWLNHNVLTR